MCWSESVMSGEFAGQFVGCGADIFRYRIQVGPLFVTPPDDLPAPLLQVLIAMAGPVNLVEVIALGQRNRPSFANAPPKLDDIVAKPYGNIGILNWLAH